MNKFQLGYFKGMVGFFLLMLGVMIMPVNGSAAALPDGGLTGMQCPNDIDNQPTGNFPSPEDIDWNGDGSFTITDPDAVCLRVGVTDGYMKMPDGPDIYIFGFVNLTGVPEADLYNYKGHAHMPAPTLDVKEGQKLYLTETNLGLGARPDIFDPHTIHFHGFPHAMAIFDGVPEPSFAVPPQNSFTYFYKLNDPGTYPYHCHQEPIEHIQMGMTGMIVVHPISDVPAIGTTPALTYAYNGTTLAPDTRYDVAYNLFIDDTDADKHHHNETIQEAANMWHTYKPSHNTINGRVYPQTILPDNDLSLVVNPTWPLGDPAYVAQTSSLIQAFPNKRVLLRLVNLGYRTHTFTIPGIPMHVVGEDAKVLRGPTGTDISYMTNTFEIAGGKTADIIFETAGLISGETYFLMARELNAQSSISLMDLYADRNASIKNAPENNQGMMTEIRIQ